MVDKVNGGVWLVIPAYNVAPHIETLLSQTSCYIPPERTVIIDDGSSDETINISRVRGVNVIKHDTNLGKGIALRDGLAFAASKGGEWALTMDGDCQHDPANIPDFLEACENGEFDILIGNRLRNGSKMPWDRRVSNGLSSALLSFVAGQKMHDVQCGFRLIRTQRLKNIEFRTERYDFETELLLKMVRDGARVGWVKVPTRYNGEVSSIRRFSDTMRFIKVISRYLIGAL